MRKLSKRKQNILLGILFVVIASVIATFRFYYVNTPEAGYYIRLINAMFADSPASIKIIDRNNISHTIFEGNTFVPLDSFKQKHIDWLLAREDRTFYSFINCGFYLPSLLKGFFQTYIIQKFKRGSSGIGMQLIRTLSQKKEYDKGRKLAEIAQAYKLFNSLSKNTILACYLNVVPVAGISGFPNAAKKYFNKNCKDLSDAEFLLLLSSLPGIDDMNDRYDRYAKIFFEEDKISLFEYGDLLDKKQKLSIKPKEDHVSLFSPVVSKILGDNYDFMKDSIFTSISFLLQDTLHNVIQDYLRNYNNNEIEASFVLTEASLMEIYCYINTTNRIPMEFDIINSKGSQPYSRIKPFTYALYLDSFATDNTYVDIRFPTNYYTYNIKNFTLNNRYSCSLNEALGKSQNSPARYVLCEKVGLKKLKDVLVSCNFINDTTELYPPAALGAFNISELNLLNLMRVSLYNGKVLKPKFSPNTPPDEEMSIVKPSTTKLIRTALEESILTGTSRGLKGLDSLGLKIWNKTGSSDEGTGVGCSGLFELNNKYYLYSLRLASKKEHTFSDASNDAIPLLREIFTTMANLNFLIE